jgi:hypothetical protein
MIGQRLWTRHVGGVRRRLALAIAVIASVLLLGRATAAGDRARAQQLLDQGVELFRAEKWQPALEKFEEAYRELPTASILYNLGQAQLKLDRSVEALEAFERFLKEAHDESPERIQRATAYVESLHARVGRIAFSGSPGTAVVVDGVPSGRLPREPMRAKAGLHKVTFALGQGPVDVIVAVQPESTVDARAVAIVVPPPPPPPGPPPPRPFYRRPLVWVVLGVATVGAAVAGGLLATRDEEIPSADFGVDARTGEPGRAVHQRWYFWAGLGGAATGAVAVGGFFAAREDNAAQGTVRIAP